MRKMYTAEANQLAVIVKSIGSKCNYFYATNVRSVQSEYTLVSQGAKPLCNLYEIKEQSM